MDEICDVAIVGYGPVGQILAILLGQRGLRVRVLERWEGQYPLPRAVHFDHEVARILQSAGVMSALAGRVEPAAQYEWRSASGEVLLRIGRDAEGSDSGWPESLMFSQPELERTLDDRVVALPGVRVDWDAEVVEVREEKELVEIGVRRESGERFTVKAHFAVGCDGANSFVRSVIGTKWNDLGFRFDWLVADVIPHEKRTWDPLNWQLCDPARPTTVVSGGPGRRRWEFMRLPGEAVEELGREEVAWRLLAPWNVRPENATLERTAVYTFRACWADAWRRGRLLLAGDAAHLTPPFAGQGMCAGIRDAANLAWKLALVRTGRASEALLDTYASERIPHVRAMIDLAVELGRVICVLDPEQARARDRRMVAEERERGGPVSRPLPPLGPGCFAAGSPAAGTLFVQGRVRHGEAEGLFDDVVGRGFVLLSPHADPGATLPPASASLFREIGGLSAHVGRGAPVDDVGGVYTRWFQEHGAAVALVRPDFAVFGTAERLDGAPRLVEALRRALGG